jgi:putative restriction endonuclease
MGTERRNQPQAIGAAEKPRVAWSRGETLLVLHLYLRTPFGKQHHRNPEVIALARRIGRSANSIAMKLNNLTSLDPAEQARGVTGLKGASKLDRALWNEFENSRIDIASECQAHWHSASQADTGGGLEGSADTLWDMDGRETERQAIRKERLAQSFFRDLVLQNFDHRCALTGLAGPHMLIASHIVGWAEDVANRVNPRNGIALNSLHDAAFDRHLVSFDDNFRLVVAPRLREEVGGSHFGGEMLRFEGTQLCEPQRHSLDRELLARHFRAFEQRCA